MCYLWIASNFGLYMLVYVVKDLPGDFFMNQLVSGLIEIPLGIVGGIAYHALGPRGTYCGSFIVAAIGGFGILFSSSASVTVLSIFVSASKGGMKVTQEVNYLASSFLFPTIFAGTAFGICNAGAKFATIFAPPLAEIKQPIPMIIFSILVGIAICVSLFLKGGQDPHAAPPEEEKPLMKSARRVEGGLGAIKEEHEIDDDDDDANKSDGKSS
jgi:nitrate/nitrite transporter NarK